MPVRSDVLRVWRPRRCAEVGPARRDQCQPRRAESGAEIACGRHIDVMPRTVAIVLSHSRDFDPPPTAVAVRILSPPPSAPPAISKSEGHPFDDRLGEGFTIALVAKPAEQRPHIRSFTGVRSPEIGQKQAQARTLHFASQATRSARRRATQKNPWQAIPKAGGGSKRMPDLVQVSGTAWRRPCTAWAVFGEKCAVETKSTPEVPSETKASLRLDRTNTS